MIQFSFPAQKIDTTGLATETEQQAQTSELLAINSNTAGTAASAISIDTKLTSQATAALQNTANSSLSSIDTKTPALGQALAAASTPVVLTAAQIATLTPFATVAVSNFPASQPVTGTFFQATQPVSALALPLPAGASTSAKQDLLLAELQLKADLTETQPVSVAALPLPTGAATSAKQDLLLAELQLKADLTETQPVSVAGRSRAHAPVRRDYAALAVTTAAYSELVASTAAAIREIEIFDSSGQTLVLAIGAAASEVDQLYVFPGGNGKVSLAIPAASRISIKAVSANASVGEVLINLYT